MFQAKRSSAPCQSAKPTLSTASTSFHLSTFALSFARVRHPLILRITPSLPLAHLSSVIVIRLLPCSLTSSSAYPVCSGSTNPTKSCKSPLLACSAMQGSFAHVHVMLAHMSSVPSTCFSRSQDLISDLSRQSRQPPFRVPRATCCELHAFLRLGLHQPAPCCTEHDCTCPSHCQNCSFEKFPAV